LSLDGALPSIPHPAPASEVSPLEQRMDRVTQQLYRLHFTPLTITPYNWCIQPQQQRTISALMSPRAVLHAVEGTVVLMDAEDLAVLAPLVKSVTKHLAIVIPMEPFVTPIVFCMETDPENHLQRTTIWKLAAITQTAHAALQKEANS